MLIRVSLPSISTSGIEDRINLFDRKVLIALTEAIVRHENGKPPAGWPAHWYTSEQYNAAADMAYKVFTGHRP